MSTTDRNSCPHGHPVTFLPRKDLGTGWVEDAAMGCPICKGKPMSIPYKQGPVQKAKEK